MIDESILLHIISQFPTKDSRNQLKNTLLDSSTDSIWRHDLSHILYILNNLDINNNSVKQIQDTVKQITETIPPEPIPEPVRELTEIEKITLAYKLELERIQKNKDNDILKYTQM